MDWEERFAAGLRYDEFLERYGQGKYANQWQTVFDQVRLSDAQRQLLGSFQRDMNVLCLAGAWCGDCIRQCPVLEHFARATPRMQLRFLDRDDHPDVQQALAINAGRRVPVVVFLSEDFHEVARLGERTLSRYRQMAREQLGIAYPTSAVPSGDELLGSITQEWLNEFERVQLLLRLSPRLRQKHGD